MKEELEKVLAALGGLSERLGKIEASQEKIAAATGVLDKVAPHCAALESCAAAMEAAGIGAHPKNGHAAKLRHMAASMSADASMGKMPHIYTDNSWQNDFHASADAKGAETSKEMKEITDQIASLATIITDLQASAAKQTEQKPERKTLSPTISAALTKLGVGAGEDGKISASALEKAMKDAALSPEKRIELKIGLERSGALETA